ncbi:TetR family transcriptional regulator [Corynebacterium sp. ES2794-CONJ1]|uniref:TetR family transcriptional regulator n=1 Tax=unclassified Corynebacterium TaxID=2624378 RepID=UPI0021677F9C|nr:MULTISPECIES: TetR family transcriptional regulator [unclassified Corynebacterium]MCS4490694.1 TetR family transcriptional regulator [Corynebacterium sp. ES2775-CONJ]MCS4492496.1 TetR family transcriptional regulator [Corynebacterium sp. ES2715-CONJ3]MCS4532540.1 TetR family transcriptional regulator [Corynebacterium sp. ES2730-CONJ]MCU9519935.1 TetR family transcriptional regulator [Corynebacterium sp. ES2794-CONJ1]
MTHPSEPQAASDSSVSEATPELVLDIALKKFSELGFTDTKLEAIAKESGMSKRMIHYHFGDKKGLYHRSLALCIHYLRPPVEELELDSQVPVDGVRKVVEAVFTRFCQHPEAIRLLCLENIMHYLHIHELPPLMDQSAITLQLDKLLMLGQDAGAFRPGISAQDVFTLISSLAVFRVITHETTINLYNVDLLNEANTQGMARMAADSVLAFLTSHLKTPEQTSYLSSSANLETGEVLDFPHYDTGSENYNFGSDLF